MKNALHLAAGSILAAATLAPAQPSPPPDVRPQAASAADGEVGPVTMGVGGSQQNLNDLCWILFRDKPRERQKIDHDRFALCLYRATNNGQAFDLVDVREVTYDFKASHLNVPGHNPKLTPPVMREAYEKARKEEEEDRRRQEENDRKRNKNP